MHVCINIRCISTHTSVNSLISVYNIFPTSWLVHWHVLFVLRYSTTHVPRTAASQHLVRRAHWMAAEMFPVHMVRECAQGSLKRWKIWQPKETAELDLRCLCCVLLTSSGKWFVQLILVLSIALALLLIKSWRKASEFKLIYYALLSFIKLIYIKLT